MVRDIGLRLRLEVGLALELGMVWFWVFGFFSQYYPELFPRCNKHHSHA